MFVEPIATAFGWFFRNKESATTRRRGRTTKEEEQAMLDAAETSRTEMLLAARGRDEGHDSRTQARSQ